MKQNKVLCPFCKSDKVRKFEYGLIDFKNKEEIKEFEKLYVIGGCVVSGDSPEYRCDGCDKDFGKWHDEH
ncbi:MAG: hypothetical protein AAB594_01615 [Patescibacteria group bacterium]